MSREKLSEEEGKELKNYGRVSTVVSCMAGLRNGKLDRGRGELRAKGRVMEHNKTVRRQGQEAM